MREITQYTVKEWLKLDPIIWFFKEKRNDAISRAFVKNHPPELDAFLDAHRYLENQSIATIIAFNSPWVIDTNLAALKKHLLDTNVIVCDNSNNPELRLEIESVCRKHDVPYLGLPPNPERHPCRSHGIALNWVYYNIILELRPAIFTFIDHDLIPIHDINLRNHLDAQPVYGHLIKQPWSWFLWAGFCMYDFKSVENKPLNFLNDRPSELDTGGRNWRPLLRDLDLSSLKYASNDIYTLKLPDKEEVMDVQILDHTWIHLCGVGLRKNRTDKFSSRAEFFRTLFEYIGKEGSQVNDLMLKQEPYKPKH